MASSSMNLMFYKDEDSSVCIYSNVNPINFDEIENIFIDEMEARYVYNLVLSDVPCQFSDIKFSSEKQESSYQRIEMFKRRECS